MRSIAKILLVLLLPVLAHSQNEVYSKSNFVTVKNNVVVYNYVPDAATTLTNGLIAFWKLDETSGTRYDSIGNNDLADSNTVLYQASRIMQPTWGNAADFEKSTTEFLWTADNADLSFNSEDNFLISAWVKREQVDIHGLVSKSGGNNDVEYSLDIQNSDAYFRTGNSNASSSSAATSGGVAGVGVWCFLCGWYNTVTDSIYVQIDDGTPVRGLAVTEPVDSDDVFLIGSRYVASYHYDGLIDNVGIWGRCSPELADSIYAMGRGWHP